MDYDDLVRLRREHPAWRLLAADSAPLVAAFLHHVFIALRDAMGCLISLSEWAAYYDSDPNNTGYERPAFAEGNSRQMHQVYGQISGDKPLMRAKFGPANRYSSTI